MQSYKPRPRTATFALTTTACCPESEKGSPHSSAATGPPLRRACFSLRCAGRGAVSYPIACSRSGRGRYGLGEGGALRELFGELDEIRIRCAPVDGRVAQIEIGERASGGDVGE